MENISNQLFNQLKDFSPETNEIISQQSHDNIEESYLERIDFVMLSSMALHRYGASADRIEVLATQVSRKLNLRGEFFSIPTGIFACFKKDNLQAMTRLERLPLGKVNLEKYCQVDITIDRVLDQVYSLSKGRQRLSFIVGKKPLYNSALVTLSYPLIGGAIATFLGGTWKEVIIAIVLSLMVGLFSETVRIERIDSIHESVSAFFVTVIIGLFVGWGIDINYQVILLSSIIVLIPGLNLTTSILELTSQNLTSGTARLMGALLGLFKLAFGVYIGTKLMEHFGVKFSEVQVWKYLWWQKSIALVFATLGFVINFQARQKDAFWILIICFISYWSSQFYQQFFFPAGASFFSGITITIASNLMSRILNRPILVFMLPAIILLVPGSIGYRSLTYLFSDDIINGLKIAMATFTIGMALVGGLFFGNILLKPRRTL
jgi:uncharacterized membrane protein YjjP (DUF1212 family)